LKIGNLVIDKRNSVALRLDVKTTSNLIKILNLLSKGPKTALELRRSLPKINKSIIYRTLRRLQEKQRIYTIILNEGEVAYEIVPAEHHHHLICEKCNSATCVEIPIYLSKAVNKFQKELSNKYQAINHRIDFIIRCPKCK